MIMITVFGIIAYFVVGMILTKFVAHGRVKTTSFVKRFFYVLMDMSVLFFWPLTIIGILIYSAISHTFKD